MHRLKIKVFKLSLFLSPLLLLSVNVSAQQERTVAGISTNEVPPHVGLRVMKVEPGTLAEEVGLQYMDVISKYGDHQIVDASSYFAAREAYAAVPDSKIVLVYWHGRERVATQVKPGSLGIEFDEYNVVAYKIDSLMQRLNVLIELPDYYRESQIAAGALQSPEKVVAEVLAAIDQAEAKASLTPAQILVAKINAILDDSPATEIEKLADLLRELVTNQPRSYTNYLGYNTFFKHKRYRAAAACFKRSLEAEGEDVSTRLNLGIAYWRLRMFDEADASADQGLKDSSLSEHGHVVAYEIKANAALGRRDFAKALDFAEKAFQAKQPSRYGMSLWLLAAAQNGDLQKFYEVARATEKALPKEYAAMRVHVDALEAYVLVSNGQREKARALAKNWVGKEKLDLNPADWQPFPSGEDVMKVWKQLQDQN
jgi:tetratricopeptide (TPR) repeat protein